MRSCKYFSIQFTHIT
ncbi:hypothetical protein Zm00014a_037377 [Zea mays]|uniref:Uncharacterized protein n=1 Tax=Zea mays TaxID=4577 RepID=A0A317Y2Z8_MAIZE|nr:hypothetical protein Zm00014a_037377 [Zea mays]